MTKLNLDRKQLDHPEHFDDEIRAFKQSERYRPTPLEQHLFEMAGHRCTICKAPWMELHHIDELSEGGLTSFENLIVLCPNCHTRVHKEGIPSKEELRHYKLKQEIAYELPVLSRLSPDERLIIREFAVLPDDEQVVHTRRHHEEVKANSPEEAVKEKRKKVGILYLQEYGMVSVEQESCIGLDPGLFSVSLIVRFTGKGLKWIRWLRDIERLPVEINKEAR